MRILIIGAGMMGRAIAYDLLRHPEVTALVIADRERARAEAIVDWLRDRRAVPVRLDATAPRAVRETMTGCAVAVSAVPYFLNLDLARAAVDAGVHFCDLGGNPRIVDQELELDGAAKAAGVTVIPDCGLAPGLVNILTAGAVAGLGGAADEVKIRVGGLPQRPRPPLGYQIVFSPHGLVNEYMEPAVILRDGKPTTV
ncbi:MAG: NAD(P)-binding domain-containing protein, partial [Nitrospiraceae bacterium]|nr:NAD(P)-binding domain-containing protein [Nitrospiraceae bacterium]